VGVIPEESVTGTSALYGDGDYGDGVYGDYVRRFLRGLITPLLTQVKIYGIYTYPSGSHTLHLGTFTLGDPTFKDTDRGVTVSVSGWDLSGDLDMARFSEPQTLSDMTTESAVSFLLLNLIPGGYTLTVPASTAIIAPQTYLPGSGQSPWTEARDLCDIEGWVLYVNRDGDIQADVVPAFGSYPAPVWELHDGDGGNLLSISLAPNAREFCNQVVVTGENSGSDPVWGSATDTTGPFGTETIGRTITREFKSDKATTEAQCVNLANRLLRKWGRLSETISGECKPIPHLEVGETVDVSTTGLELEDTVYVLETITVPLSATRPCEFTAVRRIG
jgi:hypothetical protein